MIKYKIKTGDKVVNATARIYRDEVYKPALSGMRCKNHKGDTLIEFVIDEDGHAKAEISACCDEFRLRILKKIDHPAG